MLGGSCHVGSLAVGRRHTCIVVRYVCVNLYRGFLATDVCPSRMQSFPFGCPWAVWACWDFCAGKKIPGSRRKSGLLEMAEDGWVNELLLGDGVLRIDRIVCTEWDQAQYRHYSSQARTCQ